MFRSKKLLKSAKDFPCQSCGRHGETIPAHANSHIYGKGMGIKAHDCFIAYLCQTCHNLVDGRAGKWTSQEQQEIWQRAWVNTVLLWFEQGIVVVK